MVGACLGPVANPYVEILADRGSAGATRDITVQGSLWLPLEVSGQREKREAEAQALVDWAGAEAKATRASAVADSVRAYGQLVVADARIRALTELSEVARAEATYYDGRVQAGDATELDAKLAELELARHAVALAEAKADRSRALTAVGVATGGTFTETPETGPAPPAPKAAPPVKNAATLPTVQASAAQATYHAREKDRHAIEAHTPLNLVVTVGRGDLGEVRVGGGVAWALPVLRTNQGEQARAEANRSKATVERDCKARVAATTADGLTRERAEIRKAVEAMATLAEPAAQRPPLMPLNGSGDGAGRQRGPAPRAHREGGSGPPQIAPTRPPPARMEPRRRPRRPHRRTAVMPANPPMAEPPDTTPTTARVAPLPAANGDSSHPEHTLNTNASDTAVDTPAKTPPMAAPVRRWSRRHRVAAALGGAVLLAAPAVGVFLGDEEPAPAATAVHMVPRMEEGTIVLPTAFRDRAKIATAPATKAVSRPVLRVVGTVKFDRRTRPPSGKPPPAALCASSTSSRAGRRARGRRPRRDRERRPRRGAGAGRVSPRPRPRGAAQRDPRARAGLERLTTARELEVAEADLGAQRALLGAAQQRVTALGGSASGPFGRCSLLRAPIAGTVVERRVSAGQSVEEHLVVFRVVDLDHLWVELSVFEQRLRDVARGDRASIRPLAEPSKEIEGKVAYVGDQIDLQHAQRHGPR